MKHEWRILHFADSQYDSQLLLVRLASKRIKCDLVRVGTREDFVGEIQRGGFDLIVADYSLGSLDGFSALNIAEEECPGVPFIFLSGAIWKEFATETLAAGLMGNVN